MIRDTKADGHLMGIVTEELMRGTNFFLLQRKTTTKNLNHLHPIHKFDICAKLGASEVKPFVSSS
jgi:hypothetical protein